MIDARRVVLYMGVILYPARGKYRSIPITAKDWLNNESKQIGWFYDK